MDAFDTYPQGYWQVKDKKFINKHQALLYANEDRSLVQYIYFDQVWQNFDRSLLGKFTLKELYKQRAQQLRDKYDYLILYFSGGADSYNALRSFVDNGIKIDEVCVKWCNATLESHTEIYRPNQIEQSSYNYLSEWDLAIKPVLEWLGQHHPNVKIQVVDWFKDRKLIRPEEVFNTVNHWHDVEVNSLAIWSPSEDALLEKGLTVGSIYGVDKPCTYLENGTGYMYFPDGATTMGTPNPKNVFGTEYFYWSPSFPILTFEMANVAINAFKTDPELAACAITNENRNNRQFLITAWQVQQKKLRHILYDNWTDRFQAFKPMTPDRSDKHWWIYKHPELVRYKEEFNDMLAQHIKQLDGSQYLGYTIDKNILTAYRAILSKKHLVA